MLFHSSGNQAFGQRITTPRVAEQIALSDAKPKIDPGVWENYDVSFVEKCITEFYARDEKGFAFRYPRQGGERLDFDFKWFRTAMGHNYQVPGNMTTYLIEQHGQNEEWEDLCCDDAKIYWGNSHSTRCKRRSLRWNWKIWKLLENGRAVPAVA